MPPSGAQCDIKRDGRTVSRAALEEMRLVALERMNEGDPPADVAASFERKTSPAIVRQTKREKAEIYFWGESGFRADAVQGQTWAAKGHTPVLSVPGQRQGINAASAVNSKGGFWFATHSGRLNGDLFVDLLRQIPKAYASFRRGPWRAIRWTPRSKCVARGQRKVNPLETLGYCAKPARICHQAGWRRYQSSRSAGRRRISSRGRRVTRAIGVTAPPEAAAKRRRRAAMATANCISIMAKASPTQRRGPAPKGK